MRTEDLQVIQKVARNVDKYKWNILSRENINYRSIEFPIEAEEHINDFYAEVLNGMTIVVGAYLSRFFYEEDKFSWEKKSYVAIISTIENRVNCIAFITNDDIDNRNKKNNLFLKNNMNVGWGGISKKTPENIISDLYDSVNRKASGIEVLYKEFLKEDG